MKKSFSFYGTQGKYISRTGEVKKKETCNCDICGSEYSDKRKKVNEKEKVRVCPSCRLELKRLQTDEEKELFLVKNRMENADKIEYR